MAASLIRAGLIDEYQMFVHPVVLGHGTPMFPSSEQPLLLRLVEAHRFASGVV